MYNDFSVVKFHRSLFGYKNVSNDSVEMKFGNTADKQLRFYLVFDSLGRNAYISQEVGFSEKKKNSVFCTKPKVLMYKNGFHCDVGPLIKP